MKELRARIDSRRAVVAIVGLGNVGLSAGVCLADAGFHVVGVDVDRALVDVLARGELPGRGAEPGLAALLAEVVGAGRFVPVAAHRPVGEADVVLLAVETPVTEDHRPRLEALRAAAAATGRVMKRGALVVVESTVPPGTCLGVVAPILEESSGLSLDDGFFLAHCPERVTAGKLLEHLRELPRACGGSTPEVAEVAAALYATFAKGALTPCSIPTAEVCKTAENAWRDVNIAYANLLALVCEEAGTDFREVRALIERLGDRKLLEAGPGVGGHCIPKDPWLFVHGLTRAEPGLVRAARELNLAMPSHVVRLVEEALGDAGRALDGSTVALLGVAYREGTDEVHASPAFEIERILVRRGARARMHDPLVAAYRGDLGRVVEGAHAAVILVAHEQYRALDLTRLRAGLACPVLVDARHVIEARDADAAGLVFRALGRSARG